QRAVLAERELRDIPFAEFREAEEDLFDFVMYGAQAHTIDRHGAGGDIPDLVGIVDGEGEFEPLIAAAVVSSTHRKFIPPSMTMVCPVIALAAGEARKTAAPTMSSDTSRR